MQSTAANENLSIHVGRNQPTLYASRWKNYGSVHIKQTHTTAN